MCISVRGGHNILRSDGKPQVSLISPSNAQQTRTDLWIRWFYSKHRDEEGDLALTRLLDLPLDDPVLMKQKAEILANVKLEETEAHEPISFNLLFRDRSETKIARRIWLSWCINISAPMIGGVSFSCEIRGSLANAQRL